MTDLMEETLQMRELEVSITSRCTLACAHCGFLVPDQPEPFHGEPVSEIAAALEALFKSGVRIDSLAILGGEPTIDGRLLERALSRISTIGIAKRLEVVTNGLTPRGLTRVSLRHIDRLSISVYGLGANILERYRTWIELVAPHVELVFRMNDEGWDPWVENLTVPAAQAQKMFDDCWYRRHCATVERGRLFVCSRIAKTAKDEEGLPITSKITLADVRGYLNRKLALDSCATCTPIMGLELVPAGVQPDNRIQRLEARAIDWLDAEIRNASARIL